jgi:SAM-dependent methyltransferase
MKSPLTGFDNCTVVKSLDPLTISKRWDSELGILWKPPCEIHSLLYWRDADTGLYFYSPSDVAGDSDLYSQLQSFPWYYMDEKWEFDAALRLLQSLPSGSRVLEIGVGQGAFLEKAQRAGLQICGMELNPAGAQAARDKGFKIVEKDMAALHEEDPTLWDAICAFQVLEHLPEPRIFLDQAIALLKPGGLLILSVPNAAIARQLDPERNDLLDQPPHHMSHWDEGVFRCLESFLPLKLMDVAFEPLATYHIGWFVGSWAKRLRRQIGQFGGKLILNRATMPFLQKVLALGLRQLVRGHTLFVCFEKTGTTPSGL